MAGDDLAIFTQALDRLKEVNALLDKAYDGVAILHLDAAIAALESRLRNETSDVKRS